jgi:hypothetical protein
VIYLKEANAFLPEGERAENFPDPILEKRSLRFSVPCRILLNILAIIPVDPAV